MAEGAEKEMALQAAEARLRSILETVPDAMIIIDERGRIESLRTAETLFGYPMAEAAGARRQDCGRRTAGRQDGLPLRPAHAGSRGWRRGGRAW